MIDPEARGRDYAWLYEIIRTKPCRGKPASVHEYIERLDTRTWHCIICGDTGSLEEE